MRCCELDFVRLPAQPALQYSLLGRSIVHYSVPAFIGSAATPTLNKPNAVAHDALSCVIPEFSLGDLGGLTVYGIYITAASFENEGSESWCIES